MPIFGGQYYLNLYTKAREELTRQNKVKDSSNVFHKMWELHCLRVSISTLDQASQSIEKDKILNVIKHQEQKSAEIYDQVIAIRTGRCPRKPQSKLLNLCRLIESTEQKDYLTPNFGKLIKKVENLLKANKHDKKWLVEIERAEKILNQIRTKGYSWDFRKGEVLVGPPYRHYIVSGDGLPRNYITSGWETNRRKH
jgi:hypothetical protein